MPRDHRGNETGDNHRPLSRQGRSELRAIVEQSGGSSANIPMEAAGRFLETHGAHHANTLLTAIDAHGSALRQTQAKRAQRQQALSSLKESVVGRIAPYRATAFEMERRYGGPEEGGWYYDAGVPVAHSRPFLTERGARKGAQRMREEFPRTDARYSSRNMRSSDMYDADRYSGADMYDYESGREHSSSDYNPAYDPEADYDVSWQRGKGKAYPSSRPHYE